MLSYKEILTKFILNKYQLPFNRPEINWMIAYADLRRERNLFFISKFIYRLISVLVSVPFCFRTWPSITVTSKNSSALTIDRGNVRENYFCRNVKNDTSKITFVNRRSLGSFNDYLFVFLLSIICDFDKLERCKYLVEIINFCKNNLNIKFLNETNFYCFDGSNATQRLLALYIKKFGGSTTRIIAHRNFDPKTEFTATITVNFKDAKFINASEVTLPSAESKFSINRLIIGAPSPLRPLGLEFKVFKLIIYHKLRKRNFMVKLHPQCNRAQEILLTLFIGHSHIISLKENVDNAKVRILITTYYSSLEHVLKLGHVHKI